MPLIFAKNFLEPCQTLCEAHRLLQRHSLWCNCGVWSLCPSSGGQMDTAWQPHGMAWHGVAWRGMCILTDLLAWEGIASDCWAVICNGLWESVQFHMKSRSATIRDSEWANFYYLLVVNDLIVTRSDKWESDSWRSPDFRLSLTSHLWALWREWPQNAFASWIVSAALLDQTAKYPETVSRSAAWDWPWLRCLKAYVQHLRSEEVTDDAVTLE